MVSDFLPGDGGRFEKGRAEGSAPWGVAGAHEMRGGAVFLLILTAAPRVPRPAGGALGAFEAWRRELSAG